MIKEMSSDSEWSSFPELSSTSEEDTLEEGEEDIEEIDGLNLKHLATEIFLVTWCCRGPAPGVTFKRHGESNKRQTVLLPWSAVRGRQHTS